MAANTPEPAEMPEPTTLEAHSAEGCFARSSSPGGVIGLSPIALTVWACLAALAFAAAFSRPEAACAMVLYLFALLQLARAETWRKAFYSGLAVGLWIAGTKLDFFWNIFGAGAVALWLVFAFWIGFFVAVARLCLVGLPTRLAWVLVPIVWCGLEYFRSEVYYLRFSWLTPGMAFAARPASAPFALFGNYGLGLVLMVIAAGATLRWVKSKAQGIAVLALGTAALLVWGGVARDPRPTNPRATVRVAGVQMEFPTEKEVLTRLTTLAGAHPEAELLVLSEYTLSDSVPETIKVWCRSHRRYLILGGKDPADAGNYFNTAFVLSPAGEIVFRQVKSVPIQFFKDGLPARSQAVWESPWGRLGICICYDLSYRRVVDRLVELGAEALVVPTMDVVDWGLRQHEMHARVAPMRASEYHLPIFRVASSGVSQLVNREGTTRAQAPCPGAGATIAGLLELGGPGTLPLDHWLGPVACGVTGCLIVFLCLYLRRPGAPARNANLIHRVAATGASRQ
jgi:apolipoprotein N-acyltransferase